MNDANEFSPEGAMGLIDAMREQVEARCRDLREAARREAAEIEENAWRQARGRLRDTIQTIRKERQSRLASAMAQIHTAARHAAQVQSTELVRRGEALLLDKLVFRWQEPGSRQVWCRSLFAAAMDRFDNDEWEIEHPSDVEAEELSNLIQALFPESETRLVFRMCDDIRAGLRIRIPGACLDGTSTGLLANRAEVAARILAAMYPTPVDPMLRNSTDRDPIRS